MTESERVAMRWAENYLRSHHCPTCGKSWLTKATVGVLMHQCLRPRQTTSRHRGVEERNAQDRHRWALTQLGGALEDVLGDRAYLDPDPTPEVTP